MLKSKTAAPIPAQRTGTTAVPSMATIDRSGFLAAKEASSDDIRFEREGERSTCNGHEVCAKRSG